MGWLGMTRERTRPCVARASRLRAPRGVTGMGALALSWTVVLGPFVLPAHAQTVPPCDLSGDVVVELFDGTALRSDLDEFAATNGPFEIDTGGGLPDGYYSVHLQSFDRHSTDSTSDDPVESWFIEGYGPDGSLVWTSEPIADVPADRDLFAATVSEGSAIPGLTEVRAVHAAYPDSTSANSVHALCVAFIAEVEPTTTTTQAPSTEPETTEGAATEPGTTDPDGVDPGEGVEGGEEGDPEGGVVGEQVSDSDTDVLGAQIDNPVLPFTGPSDSQWAAFGSGLAVLGSLVIAAMREDDPWHTLERSW